MTETDTIVLGETPKKLTVVLTRGADFVRYLESVDDDEVPVDWLPGETVTIVFSTGDMWPATLEEAIAGWDVQAEDVDLLAAARPRTAKLLYSDGAGFDAVWGRGSVVIG